MAGERLTQSAPSHDLLACKTFLILMAPSWLGGIDRGSPRWRSSICAP